MAALDFFVSSYNWLVVWNICLFENIGNVIIPTDELIFFRGVELNHQPDHYYDQKSLWVTINHH